MNWIEQAACAGQPGTWFPESPGRTLEHLAAIDTCNRCPVQAQCLTHAVEAPELHGIWGGTTPDERVAIRANRRKPYRNTPAECGTNSGYHSHKYRREEACAQCKAAHTAYTAARRRMLTRAVSRNHLGGAS